MLPGMLEGDDKTVSFIDGFVWKEYQDLGLEWLDQLPVDQWNAKQKCRLLIGLPFDKDAWATCY